MRVITNRSYVKNYDCARRVVDEIDNVIEGAGHGVDVFAIKRRDEGLIKFRGNGMSQLVTSMFEPLNALRILLVVVLLVREHLLQLARGFRDVHGHLHEEVKVLFLSRQEI